MSHTSSIGAKLGLLAFLALAHAGATTMFAQPIAAEEEDGGGDGDRSKCGDCQCDPGQCCSKGTWGSCDCTKCVGGNT